MKLYVKRNQFDKFVKAKLENVSVEGLTGLQMAPKIHRLKILPEFFIAVGLGYKTFEIRKNDRDFKVNDVIFLQEWQPDVKDYTGRQVAGQITYITDYEQKEDFVVMSFRKFK